MNCYPHEGDAVFYSGDQTTWAEQYNAGAEDWLNEYGREMGDAAVAEQVPH